MSDTTIKTAAEAYMAAVFALGELYRGADEVLIRLAPPAEPVGYVAVTLGAAGATRVTLKAIRALTRGRGDGTRVLLTLVNLADMHGVTLVLSAAPLDAFPTPRERVDMARRLKAWYERFGFRGPLLGLMVREPNRLEGVYRG